MTIIVTGGYGLVGHALQKCINDRADLSHFYFVSRSECDLRDSEAVNQLFTTLAPVEAVIHLASKVGGVYDNMNGNYTYLLDNTRINTNVVDACKRYNVKRLINILSTCIFPDVNITYPLTSDQLHCGLPHDSNIGYAYSKRILHVASELLSKTGGTEVVNLIPTNLYGEYDNYNLVSSHVIPGLIHKTWNAKQSSNAFLEIYGSGNAVRQFLYADDLARVILEFLDLSLSDKHVTCIVSPPATSEISIKNLVKIICSIFNFTGTIKYNVEYSDGQLRKTASNTELQRYLPDFQFTPFVVGIENTIDFFIKNYEVVRK